MGACYIINAPWVFYALWKGLTPIMSPNTLKKVKVRSEDSHYCPEGQASIVREDSVLNQGEPVLVPPSPPQPPYRWPNHPSITLASQAIAVSIFVERYVS